MQDNSDNPPARRFAYLLAALVTLLILYPFHNRTPVANVFFAGLNSTILVAALFAASRSRRTLLIALTLAVPVLVLEWVHTVYRDRVSGDLLYLAVALFYGLTIFHVLRDVLRPGPVTLNKISGAVAAYILAAIGWASLYGLADSLVPGSFSVSGQSDQGHPLDWQDFLFFSFTTLTSTGYGDTIPVERHAQSLAILEQLAGVFYVAILIARLTGLYQPHAARHTNDKGSN